MDIDDYVYDYVNSLNQIPTKYIYKIIFTFEDNTVLVVYKKDITVPFVKKNLKNSRYSFIKNFIIYVEVDKIIDDVNYSYNNILNHTLNAI